MSPAKKKAASLKKATAKKKGQSKKAAAKGPMKKASAKKTSAAKRAKPKQAPSAGRKKAAPKRSATKKSATKKAPGRKAPSPKKAARKKVAAPRPVRQAAGRTERLTTETTSAASSRTTRDHDEIRRWVQARGGVPSTVSSTMDESGAGVLRIDFPIDGQDANLEPVSWEDFFEKFDEAGLSFLYQEQTADGGESRFFNFVREGAET